MKLARLLPALALAGLVACDDDEPSSPTPNPTPTPGADTSLSFFVTSQEHPTGNLGGLAGADATCQSLASAAGAGGKTWRAYLSAARGSDGQPVDARNRIGSGPWFNAQRVMLAANLNDLHARTGDAAVFLDERGERIPGQWPGSPTPVEHDILTGSTADGRLMAGMTCEDWTSSSSGQAAQIGHSDGLGPNADPTPPRSSWNSAHANESCANTTPRGGAGRIYCFAVR
jgi:hypothetical protein